MKHLFSKQHPDKNSSNVIQTEKTNSDADSASDSDAESETPYLAMFMGFGVALGIIFDQLALGISFGVLFGLIIKPSKK